MNEQVKNKLIFFDYDFTSIEYDFTRYNINYVVVIFKFLKKCKLNLKSFLRKNDICIKISDAEYLILFFDVLPKFAISPILSLEKKIIKANNYMFCSKDLFRCVFCNRCEKESLEESINYCIRIIGNNQYFSQNNIFTGV